MVKVVLAEQPHISMCDDSITAMRIYALAASKRAALAKEDDWPTRACIHAHPARALQIFH
eukprot:4070663-Pyramimonas_sp.AAC.1